MEIPTLITSLDSRIKEVAYNCYTQENGLKRNDFERMITACASDTLRTQLYKYWKKMPARVLKKTAKYSDEDWDFSTLQLDESLQDKKLKKKKQQDVNQADKDNHLKTQTQKHKTKTEKSTKTAKPKPFDPHDAKPHYFLPSRETAEAVISGKSKQKPEKLAKKATPKKVKPAISREMERVQKLKQLAQFASSKKVKHMIQRLDMFPGITHFQFIFERYRYTYDEKKLARFLLAYHDRQLLDNDALLEEKALSLINNSPRKTVESKKSKDEYSNLKEAESAPILAVVPWDAIEFCNGEVKFYAFRLNGALILKERQAFTVRCPESRESYNYIKQHFVNILPNIKAYKQGADIVELESELHLLDAIRLLKAKVEFADWEVDDNKTIAASSFERAEKQDQEKILARLRARKSLYFNYLIRLQRQSNRRIVPCTELLMHSDGIGMIEDAFIFTIVSRNRNEIKLVFENVNEARASLVFVAASNLYEKALRCIFDFMRSEECNKRQRLHYKNFHFSAYGILRYYITNHTTIGEWSHNL